MTERIYICTTFERLGLVLSVVWPYLADVDLPTEEDPSYLLTIDVPLLEWNNVKQKLTATA